MISKNIKGKELSEKSGISYSTLSKFLSNQSHIRSDKLLKILKVLDFDLNEEIRAPKNQTPVPKIVLESLSKLLGEENARIKSK